MSLRGTRDAPTNLSKAPPASVVSPGMEQRRVISTRTAHLWIDDDLIVHCDCLPGFDTTKADAVAIAAATWKVAGERRRPGLVDIRSSRSIDRAARAHFSGPACARTNAAVALVIGSPLSRMVGNFFIGLNKPLFPTRLFTLEADAHTWLRGFLE